ncbi:uncharacterized protein LOC116252463 isoform X2 [Nymphaea colorata]|uniref:uncharacterized protein LOC116252463 isoform X2 n=1 Tax=Nymphaea colorata TaxID=210225 RepID=UPI00129EB8F6|nr:uncharacterized protein LOC116252463 isoform X2 [Nymphaea colorata]
MFKGAKWRSEKNKIKAVFKVQVQATQVPQTGWDSLLVALVPSETGKPSAKTEKVQVHNGACIWGNPVYETVKLSREPKTGKFEGKKYQFIVSNGSSKDGILGRTAVDFAEYADAIEPCSASLSLGASNSTILHITIQRLHADGNTSAAKRSAHTESLRHQMSDVDTDGSSVTSCSASSASKDVLAGNGIVQFSPSIINTVPRTAEYDNKGFRSSDAISASSSDSSSGNDLNHEYKFKADIHKDTVSILSPLSDHTRSPQLLANGCNAAADHKECEDSNVGWSLRWTSKESKENSMNTSKEMNANEKLQASEIEVAKLKDEIAAMGRQAEVSDVEVQTLRKQIIKESKKVQEFSKEICSLREERDALRQQFEQIKASRATDGVTVVDKAHDNKNDDTSILEEIKQELVYEQQLNSNLHLQLQKTQQANSELILAVQDLELLLEQKEREISHVSSTARCSMPVTDDSCQELSTTADALQKPQVQRYSDSQSIKHEGDQEQLELEVLIKEHDDADNSLTLEQKILQLQNELEECKTDRDHIEMQMEQLALDYEILKQENHDMAFKLDQSEIQEQLKMQYEASVSLAVINDLEAHVENLEKELAKQEEAFEAELAALTREKVEQERRAIRAEEMLRKTRQSNADTADRLQQEFKMLFTQMSVTFGANEKLAMQAMTEANDLRIQKSHLEESLKKSAEELQLIKDHYDEELTELSCQLDSKTNGINQLLSEVEYLSTELKAQKKIAEVAINTLADEILSLKADIQVLIIGKNDLFKKVEEKEKILLDLQEMKIRMNEKELILEKGDAKIKSLEREILQAMAEAGKSQEELHDMRILLVEKEEMIAMVQSEKETIAIQYNQLKQSLFEHETEKQNLKKEFPFTSDLENHQEAVTATEKKVIDNASSATEFEENANASIRNDDSHSIQQCIEEVFRLQHKIKLLEEEVKIKEPTIQVSKDEFTEKERDLYARIEELQKAALSQSWNISTPSDGTVQESQHEDCRVGDNPHHREETSSSRSFSETGVDILSGVLDHADNEQGSAKSIVIDPSDEQKTCNPCVPSPDDITKMIDEISQLKKKNTSMEDELKEMQERYSDLSLKFAEVEGERQQLIMSVRNLKNAKRT